MYAQKISISLPQEQCQFIEQYQLEHHCKSRSDVINQALILLQEKQLETAYAEANAELDYDLDHLSGEGLDHGAW